MAISKKRKEELVNQYVDWIDRSQAMVLVKYVGLSMKEIDELRAAGEISPEIQLLRARQLGQSCPAPRRPAPPPGPR